MQKYCYVFNEQCDIKSWLNQLSQNGKWQQEPWQDKHTTYYDTFDWRLYRKNTLLEQTQRDGSQMLSLRSHDGDLLTAPEQTEVPAFAWDLPAGKLRKLLTPQIKMRRLLPQVTVRCHQQNMALLNNDGKTILRLRAYAQRQAIDQDGAQHPLRQYLQLLPVRGYRSALKRIEQQLRNDSFLQPLEFDSLTDALDAIGRQPADYSSKLELKLQKSQTAQQALRTILLHLLDTIKANINGTCNNIDSEFLHDLRVSVRRTRSALSQLKGLLPAEELAPFRESFAWLGNITGPTRDLDVYLLKFDDYSKRLPENHQQDLVPFHRFLNQRQTEEQQELSRHLRGSRCSELLSAWQTLLEQDRDPDPALPDAELPVKKVSDRRIWKLYKRTIKEGRAITGDSPAEDLHELRKTCKKLRYLLEFFQSLYPAEDMAVLIRALKSLQDNLGDFNDYEVQSEAMHDFGLQMAKTKKAPPATLLAMGMLAESLRHQQSQTRMEFERRFATFCEDRNRELFRQMFK